MRSRLVALSCSLALAACLGHQSSESRAQEAAMDLNVHARFGRMEIAAAHVAPSAREAFLARRKAWGRDVRVADYELADFKMKGEADAETLVRVAWYRVDEGDLHVTTLRQQWRDHKGDWRLVDEQRADGEVGLLGEPVARRQAPTGRPRAHFPTIRLGTSDAAPAFEAAPAEDETN